MSYRISSTIAIVLLTLIGCGGEEPSSSSLIDTKPSHNKISLHGTDFNYSHYYSELYRNKECQYGYIENNGSLCYNKKGELDNFLFKTIKTTGVYTEYTDEGHILPTAPMNSDKNYPRFLNNLIKKKQHKKDIYCEDLIERTTSLSHGTYNIANFESYQSYIYRINVDFFNIDGKQFILIDNIEKDLIQSTLNRYKKQEKYKWFSLLNKKTVQQLSFTKNNEIYLSRGGELYKFLDNNSSNLKSQGLYNGYSYESTQLSRFSDFPVDDNGTILRIADSGSSFITKKYQFYYFDYLTNKETELFKEFKPFLTEKEGLTLIGPLMIDDKWDKKSFLASELVGTGEKSGSMLYQHYLYFQHYIVKFENNEWSYSLLPYDSVYNKSTIRNTIVQNKIESLLTKGRLTFDNFQYFKTTSNREMYFPMIDKEIYFYIKDENTTEKEKSIIAKSFTKVFNIPFKRYEEAIMYFYEPFHAHLKKDGKLHIFSVENTCQNVSAEYIQYSGYKINGKINGNLYHYVVDLTKDDYLKPIFEEKVLNFQW
ncbi:MAG: hypothetical protein OIF32_07060 [Campylobacterales bacterium]|nr:hypothetical protein [Campylobacterales bacterium]